MPLYSLSATPRFRPRLETAAGRRRSTPPRSPPLRYTPRRTAPQFSAQRRASNVGSQYHLTRSERNERNEHRTRVCTTYVQKSNATSHVSACCTCPSYMAKLHHSTPTRDAPRCGSERSAPTLQYVRHEYARPTARIHHKRARNTTLSHSPRLAVGAGIAMLRSSCL